MEKINQYLLFSLLIVCLILLIFILSGCRCTLTSNTEQFKEAEQLKEIKPPEFYKDWENHLIDWKLKHPEIIPTEKPPQFEEYYQEWKENSKEKTPIRGGGGTARPSLDSLFPSSIEPSLDYLFPSSIEP